jgi:hypothetical protein
MLYSYHMTILPKLSSPSIACRLLPISALPLRHSIVSQQQIRISSRQDTEGLVPVAEEQGLDLRLGMMRLSCVEGCDLVEVLGCKL